MYECGTKSEASLARAIHILTLGSFAWQSDSSSTGGTDIGSVFYHSELPSAKNWVDMALLRNPAQVMKNDWYEGELNALLLLKKLASETMVNDSALRSGAAWLCDVAVKLNPTAAALLNQGLSSSDSAKSAGGQSNELEKRKAMAKARQQQAMEKMKAQMAKFAQAVDGENDASDEDEMSVQGPSTSPNREEGDYFEQPTFTEPSFTTPVRNRADSEANSSLHAIDLGSPGEFVLTTPPPSYPSTPRTPLSSGSATPKSISCHVIKRLLNKRPQCIICGSDSTVQSNEQKSSAALESESLGFCAYVQPSVVAKGGGGSSSDDSLGDQMRRHVGVFVNLCGHAVHSSCCENYLKTVHRDDRYIDRLEGGKRKEFRCPLCQRLSNCLVPFIDVGVDWIESPAHATNETKAAESDMLLDNTSSVHNFLSSTAWWSSRNDQSMLWDGHCSFSGADMKPTSGISTKKHVFGKKDLISAWNRVLRTPRLAQRTRGSTPNRGSDSDLSFPNLEPERQSQRAADVWRRYLDTISDTALKTDTKRMGEGNISDYGEFRHYFLEKAFYNKMNRAAGKESMDVSIVLFPSYLNVRITAHNMACNHSSGLDAFLRLQYPNLDAKNSRKRSCYQSCCLQFSVSVTLF